MNKENLLKEYIKEILIVNQNLNLTSIKDYNTALLLHLEDSLSIVDLINDCDEGLYLDIGSGGGFPGVPLGVMTGRETILLDSVKKKMDAVAGILNKLNILNIKTVPDRVETFSINNRNKYSVITARAVSSIPSLLELASPLLKVNGKLILLKSKKEEVYDENKALDLLGLQQIEYHEYYLSDNITFRCAYEFKKVKDETINLPRKLGLAQKRPLLLS